MPPPQLFFNITSPTGGLPVVNRTFGVTGNISTLFVPTGWSLVSKSVTVQFGPGGAPVAAAFIGAILGIVSFFIYVAAIQSTTSSPKLTPNAPGSVVYYLVAFVVGYREDTFRALIKRFVDLLLAPGS